MIKVTVKVLATLLLLLIILMALALSTLNYSLPRIAQKVLADYNIDFTVEAIDVKLLRGELTIKNLAARDRDSADALTIDALGISVAVREAIRNKVLRVDVLDVRGVEIPVRHSSEQLTIAGIDAQRFAANKMQPEPEPELVTESSISAFGWSAIELRDIDIRYTRLGATAQAAPVTIPVTLHAISLGEFSSVSSKTPTPIQVKLLAANINASFVGNATPLDSGRSGHISVKLANINLKELIALASDMAIEIPDTLSELNGLIDYEGRIDWWISDARTFINLNASQLTAQQLFIALTKEKTASGNIQLNARTIKVALNPFSVALTDLEVFDSDLMYSDNSLSSAAEIQLDKINLAFDALDLAEPKQISTLALVARLGDFGKLQAKGKLSLLDPRSSGQLTFAGEQLNLTDFSGFSQAALGRTIRKGALDFNFDAVIAEGMIDSKLNLEAHQLSLDKIKKSVVGTSQTQPLANTAGQMVGVAEPRSGFESELGMPLNTALNLLRDKDDTIRLKIPVKGPVDDPSINVSSIINTAIFKTFKTAVITQVGPLMALSALDKVKSLSDAAKLKPAVFAPGQTELDASELKIIDKLADFMTTRERIKLNVCGVANMADLNPQPMNSAVREQVAKRAAERAASNEQLAAPAPTAEQTRQLQELAKARGIYAKNRLIDKAIDGKRLILCAAEIEARLDTEPRVDFSL